MGYLLLQFYNIAMDDSPYGIIVNSEVFMDKEIAHPSNVAPSNFRMGLLEIRG